MRWLIALRWLCLVIGICTSVYPRPVFSKSPKLHEVYSWTQLEFDYASLSDRQHDIDTGVFTPGIFTPNDVDVYYPSDSKKDSKIFVTIPRFINGIPATLGTITNKKFNGNPIIKPYPDWSWHRNSSECHTDRLVSVFRTRIDECGRFWVLDDGKIGSNPLCTPQLIAFNLTTNQILYRKEIPLNILQCNHLLNTFEVDIRQGCQDTFIYVADNKGFSLVVYDLANDKLWPILDKTFFPFPSEGTYTISGESFDLMDGILGVALTPYIPGQDRIMFYHAMTAPTENWVNTSYLRNSSLFNNFFRSAPYVFNTFKGRRHRPVGIHVMNKDGITLFGPVGEGTVACWNTRREYGTKHFHVVFRDLQRIQFPTGVKIIVNKEGEEELWFFSSRFQKLLTGTINPNETNYWILTGKVDELLSGSKCILTQ